MKSVKVAKKQPKRAKKLAPSHYAVCRVAFGDGNICAHTIEKKPESLRKELRKAFRTIKQASVELSTGDVIELSFV